MKVWVEDITVELGHVELAEYYEKKGDYLKAFEEYRALCYLTPFNFSAYLHAAKMLVEGRYLDKAVPYLLTSLEFEESTYANKWLGQIYLNNTRTDDALPYLKKAFKRAPGDAQLVYNLSGAYALSKQYDLAKSTLGKLYDLNPNFPGASDLKRQLEKL